MRISWRKQIWIYPHHLYFFFSLRFLCLTSQSRNISSLSRLCLVLRLFCNNTIFRGYFRCCVYYLWGDHTMLSGLDADKRPCFLLSLWCLSPPAEELLFLADWFHSCGWVNRLSVTFSCSTTSRRDSNKHSGDSPIQDFSQKQQVLPLSSIASARDA